MISLFLDTTEDVMVFSVLKDGKILNEKKLESPKAHSVYAVEVLKEILEISDLTSKDIDKIFVVNGPGSFTGIRIGVTIAKTYAYTHNIPIVEISNLKMRIFNYTDKDYYIVIKPDKRDLSYLGIYDKNYETIFEGLVTEETIKDKIDNLGSNIRVITDLNINIEKMIEYYDNQPTTDPHKVNPNYLKEVL